ncbi:MAG: nucleoside-diphosphate kinase [Verrucomicrobiae bacterium]|nr:nucleoside-diphosphate kinase [Verrucomicrobiae bacterium]
MAEQLAHVIITPYSLYKSRTGGILARLLARTGLELAAARMFAPSRELVEAYAQTVVCASNPADRRVEEWIRDYLLTHVGPDPRGRRRRVMMLLFRGEDAVRKVYQVVGTLNPNRTMGETIRDTYGDVLLNEDGTLRYFEPAVLAAPTPEIAVRDLRLWGQYSDRDGGLLENVIEYPAGQTPEKTLVLIKPENFRFPTGRPGNMIDYFSRTGLYIVAIKVHRMSVAEACEFYGPVREVLRQKLKGMVAGRAKAVLEKEFEFHLSPEVTTQLGELLGPVYGDSQFDAIVRFMAGRAPGECDVTLRHQPGTEKCIALVYEGINAVAKIRDVLGPTDPSKAPPGSIRREFGSTIMVNAAHASDSPENARREMGIVKPGDNQFRQVVEEFLGPVGGVGA